MCTLMRFLYELLDGHVGVGCDELVDVKKKALEILLQKK